MAVTGERLIYDITVNSKGASQELKDFDKSVQQLNKSTQNVSKTFDLFKGVLAGYLSFQGAKMFLELADAMQETNTRLTILTGSSVTAAAVQEELFQIAQKHSVALKDLSKSYIAISPVLKEQGKTQREALAFTDNIIASYKLIGQSSSEAAQSIQNLAHAYASGKIDANQLTKVLTDNREILKAVAAQMGVSEKAVKALARSGAISGETFFQAVIKAGKKWQEEAKKLPTGIDEAMTNLTNSLTKLAGEFAPIVELISKFILLVSENFPAVAGAILGIATAIGVATAATIKWNLAFLANPVTWIAAGIGVAVFLIIKYWDEFKQFLYVLWNRDIPNWIDKGIIAWLEFGKAIEEGLKWIGDQFIKFFNLLIEKYNIVADKLNFKKLTEIPPIKLDQTGTDKEIAKITDEINKRTAAVDKYIKALNKVPPPKKTGLDDAGTKPKDITGTVEGDIEKRATQIRILGEQLKGLKTDDVWGGFKNGVQEAIAKVPTIAEGMNKIGEDLFNGMTDSLTNFVKTGKLELKSLFDSISTSLIKLAIQKGLVAAIDLFVAKGAVFENGNVTPFAKGGVVTKPTLFPFASGVGLMGEAGPEAIMPLHRDSRGSLGVKSAGQGGSSTVVNVYNQTKDSEVETKESEDPNGVKKIDVYITQKIKTVFQTGQMDKTMQNNFGLSRAGVR